VFRERLGRNLFYRGVVDLEKNDMEGRLHESQTLNTGTTRDCLQAVAAAASARPAGR
jgi:hypothetical protein